MHAGVLADILDHMSKQSRHSKENPSSRLNEEVKREIDRLEKVLHKRKAKVAEIETRLEVTKEKLA